MAGIYKIYAVGQQGGFLGADGVNPIWFLILVGSGDRQWFEPHYFDPSITPLGRIRTIIPESPDSPHALLDACIAFCPGHFERCPSIASVQREAEYLEVLDFDLEAEAIPQHWTELRSEAQSPFQSLHIWEATLVPIRR